jgi:hypothetical protein
MYCYIDKNGGRGGGLTKAIKYDIILSETEEQYKMNVLSDI